VEKAMTKALHKKVERGKKFLSFFLFDLFIEFSAVSLQEGIKNTKGAAKKKRTKVTYIYCTA
jgi:hypothetical protein